MAVGLAVVMATLFQCIRMHQRIPTRPCIGQRMCSHRMESASASDKVTTVDMVGTIADMATTAVMAGIMADTVGTMAGTVGTTVAMADTTEPC